MKITIQKIIEQCLKENPCELIILEDEPMSLHTTFKVGGPADFYIRPSGNGFLPFCQSLFRKTQSEAIPVFILGGGANVVVSDKGIRGIVLDVGGNVGVSNTEGKDIVFFSGTSLDEAAEFAAKEGFSGLEFLAGMPGTIGGALWMNARCYGKEIADVLEWADVIDFCAGAEPVVKRIFTEQNKTAFDYKKSPFQNMDCLIICACFSLENGDKNNIYSEMEKNRQDRKEKGHFDYPSAGSVFKNDRSFGKPTGKIIDDLGLKGLKIGGAQVAPFHGNIIINTGDATAKNIRDLADEVAAKVKAATGFILEPEILFIGE